jgi:hypothetical protein
MAVAVVDRTGQILGVYDRPGADLRTQDIAVSLARTGAFFSNNAAPLSSRTVRFISGIHFPPGVPNTGNAALYGIENTNRGCSAGTQEALFTALPLTTEAGRQATIDQQVDAMKGMGFEVNDQMYDAMQKRSSPRCRGRGGSRGRLVPPAC